MMTLFSQTVVSRMSQTTSPTNSWYSQFKPYHLVTQPGRSILNIHRWPRITLSRPVYTQWNKHLLHQFPQYPEERRILQIQVVTVSKHSRLVAQIRWGYPIGKVVWSILILLLRSLEWRMPIYKTLKNSKSRTSKIRRQEDGLHVKDKKSRLINRKYKQSRVIKATPQINYKNKNMSITKRRPVYWSINKSRVIKCLKDNKRSFLIPKFFRQDIQMSATS